MYLSKDSLTRNTLKSVLATIIKSIYALWCDQAVNVGIHLEIFADQTIMVLYVHKEMSRKTITHREMKPCVPQNLGDFVLIRREETHFFSLCS